MKKTIKLLFIPLSLYLLQGCCWTDHSDVIKEVAVPMQKELENFHSQTKRLPTMEERDVLLRKVGCRMQGNFCFYKRERIKIITFMKSYNFKLELSVENTGCFFGISKSRKHTKVTCDNGFCIDLGQ